MYSPYQIVSNSVRNTTTGGTRLVFSYQVVSKILIVLGILLEGKQGLYSTTRLFLIEFRILLEIIKCLFSQK